MTVTLKQIETDLARVNALVEAFKAQSVPEQYVVAHVTIPLAAGERVAGQILNEDGTLSHYLILMPGQAEDVTWQQARDWAVEQGGELPTRREQALLFSNLKQEFEERYYWSCEEHESDSGWAWYSGLHPRLPVLPLQGQRASRPRRPQIHSFGNLTI